MHYYIDGYNLLFRVHPSGEEFKEQRQRIIHDLSQKIDLLEIDATIVFDATFQIGESSRSHYKQLEIVYTDEGETADEYIVNELKSTPNPSQETIVTSDKKLAWYARRQNSKTESVEEFITWLNNRYKNKLNQLKKARVQPKTPLKKTIPQKSAVSPDTPLKIPSVAITAEECFQYYLNAFEIEYKEIKEKKIELKQTKNQKAREQHAKPKQKNLKRKQKDLHLVNSNDGYFLFEKFPHPLLKEKISGQFKLLT